MRSIKTAMRFLPIVLINFLFFIFSCSQQPRPNILLIVTDDLGYTDLSGYGSTFYETPNIDALVRDGVKFTRGYATSPVCSPSRASIQAGKYPTRVNITDWIPGRAAYAKPSERDRLLSAVQDDQLALEEVTIAEALKDEGYKTFFAGKWHLGEDEQYWPENQGYEINKGGWRRGGPLRNQKEGYNGYFTPYGNPRLTDGPEGEYLPGRLTKETMSFIEKNADHSFFICLSFYLVHIPLQGREELIAKYEDKAKALGLDTIQAYLPLQPWMQKGSKPPGKYKERIAQGHAVYAAMIEALDRNIGKVIDHLKEKGLYDNTLIIFTADNGGLSTSEGSPTSNLPLRGGKGWLYEGGIRVPFSIKYPTGLFRDKVSDLQVSGIDIFPTTMAILGIDNVSNNRDGLDITPYLKWDRHPERALFWHYPHYSNQGGNPGSVIIQGDYKLIDDFETGQMELYNLKNDIGEEINIADKEPEILKNLFKELDDWRRETGARMMQDNPGWNGGG